MSLISNPTRSLDYFFCVAVQAAWQVAYIDALLNRCFECDFCLPLTRDSKTEQVYKYILFSHSEGDKVCSRSIV